MFPRERPKPFPHGSPKQHLLPLETLSWSDLDLQGQAQPSRSGYGAFLLWPLHDAGSWVKGKTLPHLQKPEASFPLVAGPAPIMPLHIPGTSTRPQHRIGPAVS